MSQKPARTGLLVCIPSRGAIAIDWTANLLELWNYLPNGLKVQYFYTRGMDVVAAREACVKQALEINARHLLFWDDDTYAPANGVLRLWNAQKPVISGVVYSKSDPSMPMVFKEEGSGPWVSLIGMPKTRYRVESTGLAFTLISMEIFKKLTPPYFAWTQVDEGGATVKLGEDTYFFNKVKEAGIEAWVDSDVMCLHADTQFTPEGKVALEFYPTKVQAEEYMGLHGRKTDVDTPAPAADPAPAEPAAS